MGHKILIADSGSTKTRWVTDSADSMIVSTQGLNPRLTPEADFHGAVEAMLQQMPAAATVEEVHFYGAGCGTADMLERIRHWMQPHFSYATIYAEGDMLGACRAACQGDSGLVGILGTGSNLCHYDGERIDRQCPSTGYLLGDEGSGNHIGRRLLKDYLEETMPEDISTLFHECYPMTASEFLLQLYQEPYPNRFLASLVPFAAEMRDNPYIAWVLRHCFDAFMAQVERHHLPKDEPLRLVGGLTATFEEELRSSAERHGLRLEACVPDPLEGLRHFHSRL